MRGACHLFGSEYDHDVLQFAKGALQYRDIFFIRVDFKLRCDMLYL